MTGVTAIESGDGSLTQKYNQIIQWVTAKILSRTLAQTTAKVSTQRF